MKNKYLIIPMLMIVFISFTVSAAFAQAMKPTKVVTPIHFDVSRNLRDVEPVPPGYRERSWKNNLIKNKAGFLDEFKTPPPFSEPDRVVQDYTPGSSRNVIIEQNYDGVSNLSGVAPPDTDGDVGPNHYFQMINLSFAIWNKTGGLLYGPADNKTIWNGFDDGQPYDNCNDGDPIVLYDQQADRWLVSQFALSTTNDKFYELVAVSTTPDPTGSWYRYAFEFTNMPDYPKFGIWPDGYYLSVNQFAGGSTWAGGGACVLDRAAMIAGNPTATMVFFSLGTGYGSLLPADCDGGFPPSGTPGYFMNLGTNLLRIWELDVDWSSPSSSTLTLVQSLTVASYTYSGISISQPGTTQKLDALYDRLMFRVQYRKFDSYAVMLTNHTVRPDASSRAGVRWYELRKTGSTWSVYQQGTYAPSDGNSRWMGSIAMNSNGDIALGYSVSSTSTYPSIRFTGQSATTSGTGVMDIAETSILAGTASQVGVNRWGDYSMMSVDPVGDLKFWYTQEYTTGSWNWKTRIASFLLSPLPTVPPVADFSASSTNVPAGASIIFTDLSTNYPTSWNWTFPGGTPSSSATQNPTVTYSTPGTYSVTLVAANGVGSDTETKTNYITVTTPPAPAANFTASSTVISPGGSVTFTDLSTNNPTAWAWEFEGGNPPTSTLKNPIVTYSSTGIYNVKLTASNLGGSDEELKSDYILVDLTYCSSKGNTYSYEWISKVAFGSFTKSSGAAGYSNFTSDVIPANAGNSYSVTLTPGYSGTVYAEYWKIWIDYNHDGDFADSGEEVFTASNVKNAVTGTVTIPANLSVTTRMRVTMKYAGVPTSCETFTYGEVEDYTIQIANTVLPPVAAFTASATSVYVGQTVTFTDQSTNTPTGWNWTFAGGTPGSSTAQNPTVTYNTAGTYDVTLVASNAGGNDTETKSGYITVNPLPSPPVANFSGIPTNIIKGQSVVFTDLSTNNPTSWNWIFEGGTPATSAAQHPTVTYATAGTYNVTLTAGNPGGSDTMTMLDYIHVADNPVNYCPSTSNNWYYMYIKKVVLGSFSNTSSGAGYSDFTSMVINTVKGSAYAIQLTPGYASTTYRVYWRVWIDYNQDGDFTDSGELAFSVNNKANAVSGTVTVSSSALTGPTRMRVSMKYSAAPTSCETFARGEVEDYTMNIAASAAPLAGADYAGLQLEVYPNPADKLLYISTLGATGERKKLTIYNSIGLVVESLILDQPFKQIDVSGYEPGMYFISVSTSSFLKQKKVIIF